jgi:hypothetical protein
MTTRGLSGSATPLLLAVGGSFSAPESPLYVVANGQSILRRFVPPS